MRSEAQRRGFARLVWAQAGTLASPAAALRLKAAFEAAGGLPSYVTETAALRAEPLRAFPRARSVIQAALPQCALPASPRVIPEAKPGVPAGLAAYYTVRMDYHKVLGALLGETAAGIGKLTGRPVRSEILTDSKPFPEKPFAALAGMGTPAPNSCVFCGAFGCGVFLGEILTDIPLAETVSVNLAGGGECAGCMACVRACPNKVFASGLFDCGECAACVTMERRGPFGREEARIAGDWLYGCGACVAACPASKVPPPVSVDLEWLLLSPAADVEKAVHGTPMERAGVSALRRNALAVLSNKRTPASIALARKASEKSKSPLVLETFKRLFAD